LRSFELLLDRLSDRAQRAQVAAELARHWGAEALIILVRDEELNVLRPAPGFQQTLPGGTLWRRFLARCIQPGEHEGEVGFPDSQRVVNALAYVRDDGTALALIGGAPVLSYEEFKHLPFGLLSALLRAEAAEQASSGAVAAAREATQRSTALAMALDRARAETQAKSAELQRALGETARLNESLRILNDTLEERIRKRTRELERETEERLRAEAALSQAQKMEAVGQLTGGVAHDFNNLLSIIIGSLDLMEGMAADNQRLQRSVDVAQRAAHQGSRLIEQLLAFARRQVLRPQTVDLNERIAEYQSLIRRAVGEAVEVRVELSPQPCYCHIDPVQLETAILNLAINARHAMPEGGTLIINTARCEASAVPPELPSGEYVQIMVKDTGNGISSDIVERVFEPFFTTKPEGKGTGLGLSQIYGFVKQSGGSIALKSDPGHGTSVSLYLPLTKRSEEIVEAFAESAVSRTSGSETILVVEDNTDVAEVVVSMLETVGYNVLVADNAASALSILEKRHRVDLLFTDLVMPGRMNGLQLARAAKKLRPEIKVALASGYAGSAGFPDEAGCEGFLFIQKPYRQNNLTASIRSALDGTRPTPQSNSSLPRVSGGFRE
jgi:signal transduction histidine kinase/ActR/RegA family two-component response regulator